MAAIDIRSAIKVEQVCNLLLQIAENPLDFVGHTGVEEPGCEVEIMATQLARQAAAAIVSSCVISLWSNTVMRLHALEPEFPLYPKSVTKFVQDTRLPLMSYFSLYYSLCGQQFEGTSAAETIKVIVDMRHALEHDKPENSHEYSTERVNAVLKWRAKLKGLVGEDAILWLPRVRRSGKTLAFQSQGEPPIMKFMKYPIAKWVLNSTVQINNELSSMMFAFKGQKKLRRELTESQMRDERFHTDSDLRRLWCSGE